MGVSDEKILKECQTFKEEVLTVQEGGKAISNPCSNKDISTSLDKKFQDHTYQKRKSFKIIQTVLVLVNFTSKKKKKSRGVYIIQLVAIFFCP